MVAFEYIGRKAKELPSLFRSYIELCRTERAGRTWG